MYPYALKRGGIPGEGGPGKTPHSSGGEGSQQQKSVEK